MSKKVAKQVETEVAQSLRGWALEKARAQGQVESKGKPAQRCIDLVEYLATQVAKPGQSIEIAFAKANAGAGLKRGERGDATNSWRTAVARAYSVFGGVLPYGLAVKVGNGVLQVSRS